MHTHHRPIQLLHSNTVIRPEDVYFAFASGQLAYDCIACKAKCCRGHGFLARTVGELPAQLTSRPELVVFLEDSASSDLVKVRNCPPACFFLSSEGGCGIHSQFGYDSKPETCRLFPFNIFRRVGHCLVVEPHFQLCPLQLAAPGVGKSESHHDKLLETMAAKGIAAQVHEFRAIMGDGVAAVELERKIVDSSIPYLDKADFAGFLDFQQKLTDKAKGCSGAGGGASGSWLRSSFSEAALSMYSLLGIPSHHLDETTSDLNRLLIAVAPSLRSQLIFTRADQSGGPLDHHLASVAVLYALLGCHVLAACAVRAGMESITFETIERLFRDDMALLLMLGHLDFLMTWRADAPIELVPQLASESQQRGFLRIAKALLPRKQRGARRSLGWILSENIVGTGLDRLRFLRYVAKALAGRITPIDHVGAMDGTGASLRSGVGRWLLGHASEAVLITAGRRGKGRKRASGAAQSQANNC